MTNTVRITGATRLYAMVGEPIVQVRSPETFTGQFTAAGVTAGLVPARVATERFDGVIPAIQQPVQIAECPEVTVPFKARIAQ